MKCEMAQENVVLAMYGELPDEDAISLEQHLVECAACQEELQQLRGMHERLALAPVAEPTPNLVAQSRMRLDEALDMIPAHGFLTRLRSNFWGWIGHVQSAPALMTLLVGIGFLAGNFTYRYQVAQALAKQPVRDVINLSNSTKGVVANVSGIVQTPNSEIVQVSYNRLVPEMVQGSLDDPQIRQLLMVGMKAAATPTVRTDSVSLLASECRVGHGCAAETDGTGLRDALLKTMRYDKSPAVRLAALEGLQPYVSADQRVRDALLEALMRDPNAGVRTKAIEMLKPVQSDSSVRQVFRTVSTTDENPYIRTVSTNALAGTADIQ